MVNFPAITKLDTINLLDPVASLWNTPFTTVDSNFELLYNEIWAQLYIAYNRDIPDGTAPDRAGGLDMLSGNTGVNTSNTIQCTVAWSNTDAAAYGPSFLATQLPKLNTSVVVTETTTTEVTVVDEEEEDLPSRM